MMVRWEGKPKLTFAEHAERLRRLGAAARAGCAPREMAAECGPHRVLAALGLVVVVRALVRARRRGRLVSHGLAVPGRALGVGEDPQRGGGEAIYTLVYRYEIDGAAPSRVLSEDAQLLARFVDDAAC